ncbi:hypothetical protein V8C37DRAFT_313729 [Trichoderma ceciliae]
MPPFKAPSPFYRWSLLCEWRKHVGPEMQSPELLWGDYWERFNTVKIPILEEYEFFDAALEIAKLSDGKEDFERLFEERNKKRKEEVLKFMHKTWTDTMFDPKVSERQCEDALSRVQYACVSGCLEDFLQVVKGIAYGWEAEVVDDEQSDESLNRSCNSCESTQLLSCKYCRSKVNICGDCGPQPNRCENCSTQRFDIDPNYQNPEQEQLDLERSARAMTYLGTVSYEHVGDCDPSSCINCGSTQLLSCRRCKSELETCGECGPQVDGCNLCSSFYFDVDEEEQLVREQATRATSYRGTVPRERYTTRTSNRTATDSIPRGNLFNLKKEGKRRGVLKKRGDASTRIQQAANSATDDATGNLTKEPQTFRQPNTESPDYDDYSDAVEHQESACTSNSTATKAIDVPASDLFISVKAKEGQSKQTLTRKRAFDLVMLLMFMTISKN